MTERSDDDQNEVAEVAEVADVADVAAKDRPVLARPHPNETVEEFSARFLAEILDAQRVQEQSKHDSG